MRKIEYLLWPMRAAVNQLAPYLLVSYFNYIADMTSVAELAAVFAAVGLANLTRSGAILSTTVGTSNLHAPLWMEIAYSVAFTLPLLALLPHQEKAGLVIVTAILLISSISGVYSSRIDISQGLTRLALIDLSCTMIILPAAICFLGISALGIGTAFLLRELGFCIAVRIASLETMQKPTTALTTMTTSLRGYVQSRLSGTIFWVTGPWKDYFVTNVGLAFYSKEVYGAFYTTQLYWSSPILVLGLLMRPAYKDVQAGRLSIRELQRKIYLLAAVGAFCLAIVDQAFKVAPATSPLVNLAVLLPLFMAAPVTAATLTAIFENDRLSIVVQNILWGATGCISLYLLREYGFDGIAYSIALMNASSIFILTRKARK